MKGNSNYNYNSVFKRKHNNNANIFLKECPTIVSVSLTFLSVCLYVFLSLAA